MRILIIILALSVTLFSFNIAYSQPVVLDEDYKIEKFAEGLTFPIAMVFIDDELFVTEKNSGKILKISENGIVSETPSLEIPVDTTNMGLESTERDEYYGDKIECHCGLLGITYNGKHVYVFHTGLTDDLEQRPNLVTKYDFDGESFVNPVIMKTMEGSDKDHVGGVLTTGNNGEIYFVIGDQDEHTNVHVNMPDGPSDDVASIFKIEGDNIERVAMGIRNSFGLAVDPITGYLWETENGPANYDEINLVHNKFNSGWNVLMGPIDRLEKENYHFDEAIPKELQNPSRINFEDFEYSDPEFSWEIPVAVTAIEFPTSPKFEKYKDSVFVGDFNTGTIYKFKLNEKRDGFTFDDPGLDDNVFDWDDRFTSNEIIFARAIYGGISDIEFHKDGMYLTTIFDGSIYKITPAKIPPPLKQQNSGIPINEIQCVDEHMPILSASEKIACVSPKSALILQNQGWKINLDVMPPIILKNQNLDGLNFQDVNLSNSDFRNVDFQNVNIKNVDFSNSNLANSNFSGKDLTQVTLDGALLRGTNLSDTILNGVNLSNKDLSEVILTNHDLTNIDLTGSKLTNADFTGTPLSNLKLHKVDFSRATLINQEFLNTDLQNSSFRNANLTNTNFENANLSNADLRHTDLTSANFQNTNLKNTLFPFAKLSGIDISQQSFDDVNLSRANLQGAILDNYDFSNKDLSFVDFSYQDLSKKNLKSASLNDSIFSGSLLPSDMSSMNLKNTKYIGTDLTNKNFSYSNLDFAVFDESVFGQTDFTVASFIESDLTKIKNKNMNDSIVTGSVFAYTHLTGLKMPEELLSVNFNHAQASETDFSNTNVSLGYFGNANLENANFENADLSGRSETLEVQKNMLTDFSYNAIKLAISPFPLYNLIGVQDAGDKFIVDVIAYNNFHETNLKNANLKNTKLFYADMTSADLSNSNLENADLRDVYFLNANLSGANLSGANLSAANLSAANLSGANLSDAIINENTNLESTILDCTGHSICN